MCYFSSVVFWRKNASNSEGWSPALLFPDMCNKFFQVFRVLVCKAKSVTNRSHPIASRTKALEEAIKRPRTRSTAARQVSNTHERDLVTNQNV